MQCTIMHAKELELRKAVTLCIVVDSERKFDH